MVRREILPAVVAYTDRLLETALRKREMGLTCAYETKLTEKLSALTDSIADTAGRLDAAVIHAQECAENEERARYHREVIFPAMQEMRAVCDETELLVAKDVWPYPSYGEMLFSVM